MTRPEVLLFVWRASGAKLTWGAGCGEGPLGQVDHGDRAIPSGQAKREG